LKANNVAYLVKMFPALYGTRRFITVLKSARHLTHILSHMNPLHTIISYILKSILILSSHHCLRLSCGLLPFWFSIYRREERWLLCEGWDGSVNWV